MRLIFESLMTLYTYFKAPSFHIRFSLFNFLNLMITNLNFQCHFPVVKSFLKGFGSGLRLLITQLNFILRVQFRFVDLI
jgi:hypothetical protein